MDLPYVVYLHSCPNCGGPITSDRLAAGLPCRECMPKEPRAASLREVVEALRRRRALRELSWVADYLREYSDFSSFFARVVGYEMWGAQRLWARRLVRGKSFAVVAPTGSGKTTFVLVSALYMAGRGRRALLIFPTSALAHQAHRKLLGFAERAGLNVRVVAYHSLLGEKEREEALAAVERGDFDVLVVTSAFLPRRFDLLSRYKFDFVAADDVDSILRATSKNIDRILRLLGVSDEVLKTALDAINLAKQLRKAEVAGDLKEAERLERELASLRAKLQEAVRGLKLGVFIASGALAKARRTTRLLLFREILGFDVGGRAEGLRNVVDLYVEAAHDVVQQTIDLLRRLGPGGIVYVQDRELGMAVAAKAREEGLAVEHFFRPRRGVLERFESGEVAALVGLGSSRSALVRGIDLPHVIRYVVFVGVPKFRFRVRLEEFSIPAYLTFLYNVRSVLAGEARYRADRLIGQLRRLAPYALSVQEALKKAAEGAELTGFDRHAVDVVKSAVEFVNGLLAREDIRRAIETSTEVKLAYIDGELYVLVPDVTTYIQGSGRTSRLYAGGLSKGLSVVVVDDQKVFQALRRELKLRFDEAEFKHINEVDLGAVLEEVDKDRRAIRDIMEGRVSPAARGVDLLKTVLMIVESPTKARTIANFFGRPSLIIADGVPIYEVSTGDAVLMVTASLGHIYELPTSLKRVDPAQRAVLAKWFGDLKHDGYDAEEYAVIVKEEGFIPVYNKIWRCRGAVYVDDADVPADCRPLDVLSAIRNIAVEVDTVLLGTDPDSEGEKIAFDLYLGLRPYVSDIRRVEFHEVTRKAVLNALANPRGVSYPLVKSQIVRRVEDRWLGFGLSKLLQAKFSNQNLSAGRVQTPVLGWVVETYEESLRNRVYNVDLQLDDVDLRLQIPGDVLQVLRKKKRVAIRKTGEEERAVNPPPPYTTDEMLRDAVNKLGFSADYAMRIAQELFESGLITYHRTDSTRVSTAGIAIAREYVAKRFGEAAFRPRPWGEAAEGAHEAIRPTRPIDVEELRGLVNAGVLQLAVQMTRSHYLLYDLIFRRFIASQMEPSVVKVAKYAVEIDGHVLEIERAVDIVSQGFQQLYPVTAVEPELPTGTLDVAVKRYRVVRRILSQADVLALMRQRGIGRPSTYARILQVLAKRYYVYVAGRRKLMIPTKRGAEIYHFLRENFGSLVSEERTRLIEQHMDAIEVGKARYEEVLKELFDEFRRDVLPRLAYFST
ncbi:reverse gyrase [Pyrobaculum neutrophilum]|uniref:Reverse gyrase n=1 Tax=Pyrobaculum neutrophilum (strain DSM 2338 / JCM 9278 / NBRC 100436 / V24Sta) TaxID=444157 RepID=B1YAT0_PYRNV|nr:reverse gyrase [Pyrobaculum neutrophilum]ACB39159.1 reverse gyrase [Pyrobaculum neutrophilum V24Sta]